MLKLRPLLFYKIKSPAILWAQGRQLNEISSSGESNWASLISVFNDQKVNLMSNIEINPPASIQLIIFSVVVSIKMNWGSHSVFHFMFLHNLYSEVIALSFLSPLPQWTTVLALSADWVSGASNVWKLDQSRKKYLLSVYLEISLLCSGQKQAQFTERCCVHSSKCTKKKKK